MEFDRVKFIGLRVTKGITQQRLAELAEVSRPTLSGWEKGNVVPSFKALNRVAKALGVEPEDLVTKGI